MFSQYVFRFGSGFRIVDEHYMQKCLTASRTHNIVSAREPRVPSNVPSKFWKAYLRSPQEIKKSSTKLVVLYSNLVASSNANVFPFISRLSGYAKLLCLKITITDSCELLWCLFLPLNLYYTWLLQNVCGKWIWSNFILVTHIWSACTFFYVMYFLWTFLKKSLKH